MKKITFIVLLLAFVSISTQSQNLSSDFKKGKLGLTFSSLGSNDVYSNEDIISDSWIDGDYFYSIGLSYSFPIKKWLDFETGLEYSKHGIILNYYPDGENHISKENFSLMGMPLTLRVNFWNYFFVNGGALLDLDLTKNMPIDDQTGLGIIGGVGAKYDFHSGLSVFVNPYFKSHSLIPFSKKSSYKERLIENGIRIGIAYNLNK